MSSCLRVDKALLDVVVIVRLVAEGGSRSERRRSASPIVESDATGRESVEGRPRPGKVVRRMLIV
jgi:hypothetical protein